MILFLFTRYELLNPIIYTQMKTIISSYQNEYSQLHIINEWNNKDNHPSRGFHLLLLYEPVKWTISSHLRIKSSFVYEWVVTKLMDRF